MTGLLTALIETGLTLRHSFGPGLLIAAAITWLVFSLPGRRGYWASLGTVLLIFMLPMAGLWGKGPGEMQSLGGLLFFSDTSIYYSDATRLLEGGLLSPFSARRPLFAPFFAFLLWLTGRNLQAALFILVMVNALACFYAAWWVRRTRGSAAGALALMLLFLFYRRFAGTPDSENLGLALGAAGFALLWRGAAQRSLPSIGLGIGLISLALNVRAGTFLVLPALVIWLWGSASFWGQSSRLRTVGLFGLAPILCAFMINGMLFWVYAPPGSAPLANFSSTVYGLASGGRGWQQVERDHPELARLNDAEAARQTYRLAWEQIREHPEKLAQGMTRAWTSFLSLEDGSVFSFTSGADLTVYDAPRAENRAAYFATRATLSLLSVFGLAAAWRKRSELTSGLLLCLSAGVLLSVPFLPPGDAGILRVYAATLPVIAAVPAAGLGWLFSLPGRERKDREGFEPAAPLTGLSVLLAVAISAGAFVPRLVGAPTPLGNASCPPGEQLLWVRINPGSYVQVVEDAAPEQVFLPLLQKEDWLSAVQVFPHRQAVAELETLRSPSLLLNAVNLSDLTPFWLVIRGELPQPGPGAVSVCGQWNPAFREAGLGFFYARVSSSAASKSCTE
jgi:hypothetical protein